MSPTHEITTERKVVYNTTKKSNGEGRIIVFKGPMMSGKSREIQEGLLGEDALFIKNPKDKRPGILLNGCEAIVLYDGLSKGFILRKENPNIFSNQWLGNYKPVTITSDTNEKLFTDLKNYSSANREKVAYYIPVSAMSKEIASEVAEQYCIARPDIFSHQPGYLRRARVVEDLTTLLSEEIREHAVAADEIHFYPAWMVKRFALDLSERGKDVYMQGISTYANGEPTESVSGVDSFADAIYPFTARCAFSECSTRARFSQRLDETNQGTNEYTPMPYDVNQIKVEGTGGTIYYPVCPRHHFVPGSPWNKKQPTTVDLAQMTHIIQEVYGLKAKTVAYKEL